MKPFAFPGCVVEATVVERITVVGPMDRANSVNARLAAEGWRVTRSGPYTDDEMFPKADVTRFLYHAERERKVANS